MGRREEKVIRLDGDCSDGGSCGQGRGASQTEVHGVRGEEGIPDRRNSSYKGLEEGDGEKSTWNTETKRKNRRPGAWGTEGNGKMERSWALGPVFGGWEVGEAW